MRSAIMTTLSALLCTACCWLPPVLLATMGTAGGFVDALAPWHAHLLAFTVFQMVIGFYLAYRPAKSCHHGANAMDPVKKRRLNIGIMWAVAGLVVALNVGSPHGGTRIEAARMVNGSMELQLAGVHCLSCARSVSREVAKLPEVKGVRFDDKTLVATVDFRNQPLSLGELKPSLERAGVTVALKAGSPVQLADQLMR